MASENLDAAYWSDRYAARRTGWDLGHANEGLLAYVQANVEPTARILIPGAGSGYEAEALWALGYANTFVLDWSEAAMACLRTRLRQRQGEGSAAVQPDRLLVADFFKHVGRYDVLLEQTFFCAIDPSLRAAYVAHAAQLLAPKGRWIGVLFDRQFPAGPPFGGTEAGYRKQFAEHFEIQQLARFEHSVAPRAGSELFGVMQVKGHYL